MKERLDMFLRQTNNQKKITPGHKCIAVFINELSFWLLNYLLARRALRYCDSGLSVQ